MIPNPWLLLGALGTAAALTLGAYFYGVSAGVDRTETAWQAREATINAASAVAIQSAETKARTAERKSATEVAVVSTEYQQKLRNIANEKDRIIAGLRVINGGLFIDTRRPQTCENSVPAAGPGPGGRDGRTRAELSVEASDFLIGEASRADQVVEQLTACQAIVTMDRD
ncbi:lysis system i-spanin subunit Rz [Thiobacillus denitrificans]|uniref:Bacteriophage lysis protein n=1 Tax=Thiobacillus denitrificans TaxID=36861 RepID=A0A106BVM7_THIDE|nr:lysis system i-spanin subunit Rz [Thiobacillus denitrificans]KVW99507.1 hypothetical protein ABW22_01425 [Thiobacillus denitrificans]